MCIDNTNAAKPLCEAIVSAFDYQFIINKELYQILISNHFQIIPNIPLAGIGF